MKTIKYFTMAALALLMTTACSNDDNDMSSAEPQQAQGITITAQLAPKEGGVTRAVYDDMHGTLVATWAEGEDIAIIYDGKQAIATVKAVAGDGSATIEFEVAGGTANNTPCTLVYPASATDNDYKLKSYYKLFAMQTGTLTADLDVRVGSGTIQTTTPGLTVTTQPQPQFSIFKLVTTDVSCTDYLNTVTLSFSDDQGNVITTATQPGKPYDTFYVALPPLTAGVYWFTAISAGKPYIARVTVGSATVAGKFYASTVKMATIGDVVLSDGKFAAKGTANERAVIAYIGSVDKYFNHFLAIAQDNASLTVNETETTELSWSQAQTAVNTYASNHAISLGGTTFSSNATGGAFYDVVTNNYGVSSATAETLKQGWRIPSVTDWRYIFEGLCHIKGGLTLNDGTNPVTPTSPSGIFENRAYRAGENGSSLINAINNACGNTALQDYIHWSSSKKANYENTVWDYSFSSGVFWSSGETSENRVRAVFAY